MAVTGKWTVYPAIDLRCGRVVRLRQGDPDRQTIYALDPLQVVRRWQQAGATWIHVVNLDGALGEASGENLDALARVLDAANRSATGQPDRLNVQFGGGMRDLASIRQAIELGVSRVVLGTAAVRHPALVEEALDAFGPQRVVVALDARDGRVRIEGWREGAGIDALELAAQWASRGIRWLIFTDVARDGMGRGLNVEATANLADATGLKVIASGGVAGLDDVRRAREAGLSGVIIGRALYEGELSLRDALRVADDPPPLPECGGNAKEPRAAREADGARR